MVDRERSRRRFLRSGAGLLAVGAAGCLGWASEDDPTPDDATPTEAANSATPSPTVTPTGTPDGAPDWPHRRRDPANTGRARAEAAPDPTGLSRAWRYATRNDRMSIPLVRGSLLVASARSPNADVFGLDADTGDERWVSRSDGLLRDDPALVSESVFVARTYAMNDSIRKVHGALPRPSIGVGSAAVLRSSGEELILGGRRSDTYEVVGIAPGASDPAWRFRFSFDWGDITDLALRDGVLYVATVEYQGDTRSGPGSISAFDLTSDEVLWERREDSRIEGLAVGADRVYATGPRTLALDRDGGEVAWTRDLAGLGTCYPALGDDLVYAADYTSLVALDAASGDTVWERDMNGRGVRPSVGGNAVYAVVNRQSDRPGKLAAFDAETGEELFETGFGQTAVTAPAIANGAVYLGVDDGSVHGHA